MGIDRGGKKKSAFILQILATDAKTILSSKFTLTGNSQFKFRKRGLKIRISCATSVMLPLPLPTACVCALPPGSYRTNS